MDRATLEAQHPGLFAALQTEFATAGAAAERQRIADVRAQLLPGHEALIETLAADGSTTGVQAAAAVLAAERNLRQAHASAQAAAAPQPLAQVPAGPLPAASNPATAAAADGDNSDAAVQARAQAAWDGNANLRAEFAGQFSTYLAYAKAQAAGQVKNLKSKE